ncbi:DUF2157 domain-containing protein [Nocardioides sp. KIGAM211]|uniref:DUF2157 domain-containing protein n=1 Tax=Nocardioides luti TaxID=2761101 RepID=A0A7X0RHW9_9ACTN|nr:DUF2157 domain-containing protein [Nocardioides luti]MBB6628638.1 DUF2157 domain-containing protein [Nocardioides luti]
MSIDAPLRPTPAAPTTHLASPTQLAWLTRELVHWQADGLVDAEQAERLRHRYRPSRRLSLGRLLLGLGAAFVGTGLIWLVAANLDGLAPLTRFGVVTVLWLAALVGGEVLATRRTHHPSLPSPVVGAARLLAALTFGAVVFQAAQSLQVPAYEPLLVGVWGLGALVQAYAVRAVMPLLVGLAATTGWFVWAVVAAQASGLAVVLCLMTAALVAVSVGALHERGRAAFAACWRTTGALLGLAGLFTAALPFVDAREAHWSGPLVAGLAVAALLVASAVALAPADVRLEPVAATVAFAAAVGLVAWDAGADASGPLQAGDVAHALVSVGVYVVAAVAVAMLGTLRDSGLLTALATVALVVFTTFQSFSVFARIVEGAWLFVLLGTVFVATGLVFDRARRELATTLEGATR